MQIPIEFEGLKGLYFYDSPGFRAPKRGEFFLSGAIPQAYRARNDFSLTYLIVRPTFHAKQRTCYEQGEKV